nr:MazG family protein [Micromonospora sp. DSM 115978]
SYLIEEAYEAYQSIEDGDLGGLREELGDVLMQVLFHARIAAESAPGEAWDVDDVAAGLVAKLVRRHPHVFAEVVVDGPDAVVTNWDAIKAVEKGRRSVTEGVPMSQPALSLAAKLQQRGAKIGVPVDVVLIDGAPNPAAAVRGLAVNAGSGNHFAEAAATGTDGTGTDAADGRFGELLFAVVALAREAGVDPELALRTASRRFRDQLAAAEQAMRDAGSDPAAANADAWRAAWPTWPTT